MIEQNNTNSSLSNSEQQTQITANVMHQNLMSIAETCLVACGQLITWALRHNSQTTIPDDELQDAGVTADQVSIWLLLSCFNYLLLLVNYQLFIMRFALEFTLNYLC